MNTRHSLTLHERLAALTPAKQRLLLERLRAYGDSPSKSGRLVAFYQSAQPIEAERLRERCTSALPQHMVPQRFVQTTELALTATGKLDREAMRARLWTEDSPDAPSADLTTARNAIEQTLTDIWCEVLGFDEISVFDNFFEVGGDSLQIIRILSRAAKAGIRIKPDALFAHPTISALARVVQEEQTESTQPQKSSVRLEGELALTPIQHWFFNVFGTQSGHWNQSMLFRLEKPLAMGVLKTALDQLMQRHSALRTTFHVEGESVNATVNRSLASAVRLHALVANSNADQREEMRHEASRENAAMQLDRGPLLRAVLFTQCEPGYVLLCAHHLIVDAVSWQVMVADLEALLDGGEVAISGGITEWGEQLAKLERAGRFERSKAFWLAQAQHEATSLPATRAGGNDEGNCRWITRTLDSAHTQALVSERTKTLRASVQEVLLSAVVRTLLDWTEGETIAIDLEGHGRESLTDSVDISQTIGWYTTVFPVVFALTDTTWHGALKDVKERLRIVPDNGLSHGVLAYLSDDTPTRTALRAAPRSTVLFNYLGREESGDGRVLSLDDARFGQTRRADLTRAYQLELNAFVREGQLHIDWAYGPDQFETSVIDGLADRCMQGLDALLSGDSAESATVSTTDFPMAGLDQSALDTLSSQLDELDDLDDD
ncbi:MAG: condensation domain-containing protein [Pseudomonadota bacterium]